MKYLFDIKKKASFCRHAFCLVMLWLWKEGFVYVLSGLLGEDLKLYLLKDSYDLLGSCIALRNHHDCKRRSINKVEFSCIELKLRLKTLF